MKAIVLTLSLVTLSATAADKFKKNAQIELKFLGSFMDSWQVIESESTSSLGTFFATPMNAQVAEKMDKLDQEKSYDCSATFYKSNRDMGMNYLIYDLNCSSI